MRDTVKKKYDDNKQKVRTFTRPRLPVIWRTFHHIKTTIKLSQVGYDRTNFINESVTRNWKYRFPLVVPLPPV